MFEDEGSWGEFLNAGDPALQASEQSGVVVVQTASGGEAEAIPLEVNLTPVSSGPNWGLLAAVAVLAGAVWYCYRR